jgi:hypothetical protein
MVPPFVMRRNLGVPFFFLFSEGSNIIRTVTLYGGLLHYMEGSNIIWRAVTLFGLLRYMEGSYAIWSVTL